MNRININTIFSSSQRPPLFITTLSIITTNSESIFVLNWHLSSLFSDSRNTRRYYCLVHLAIVGPGTAFSLQHSVRLLSEQPTGNENWGFGGITVLLIGDRLVHCTLALTDES